MVKESLPNIFEYNNFRTFLADYQEARAGVDGSFTKSYICKALGLPRTRSYFNDVLNGKEVTPTFVERFIRLLGFGKDEAQFFRVLVQFNQAQNPDEREFHFEQLISLNKTPTKQVDPRALDFYREWHHAAIRAMLDIRDFRDDYADLSKRLVPAISAKKARDSVRLLLDMGLARVNDQGFVKPTDKAITSGPYSQEELVKQYQLKCLDLAQMALLNGAGKPQNISTSTISISEEGYKRLEKLLQRFKSQVRSMVHKDEMPATRVYQLNIQLFPSSK